MFLFFRFWYHPCPPQWCMEGWKHGRKSPQKHAGSSGSFGSLAMSLFPYVIRGCSWGCSWCIYWSVPSSLLGQTPVIPCLTSVTSALTDITGPWVTQSCHLNRVTRVTLALNSEVILGKIKEGLGLWIIPLLSPTTSLNLFLCGHPPGWARRLFTEPTGDSPQCPVPDWKPLCPLYSSQYWIDFLFFCLCLSVSVSVSLSLSLSCRPGGWSESLNDHLSSLCPFYIPPPKSIQAEAQALLSGPHLLNSSFITMH